MLQVRLGLFLQESQRHRQGRDPVDGEALIHLSIDTTRPDRRVFCFQAGRANADNLTAGQAFWYPYSGNIKIRNIYGAASKLDRAPQIVPRFDPDTPLQRDQQFEQGVIQPTPQKLPPTSPPATGLPPTRQGRAR